MGFDTDRRTLLASAAGLTAAAVAPAALARATGAIKLHDPAEPHALALADAAWPHAGPPVAITGERIRFGREVFARRPGRVLAVTRYADFHLLEDVGREAGYRTILVDRIADATGRPALFVWTAEPRA